MIAVDVAALAASVVACTLAIVAIALSIVFYRMSQRLAEDLRQTQRDMTGVVGRLDKLFDTLYGEALSMMKDRYAELRSEQLAGRERSAGPASSPPADLDEKLRAGKREILDGMSALLARAKAEHRDVETMSAEVADLIDRAIAQSRPG